MFTSTDGTKTIDTMKAISTPIPASIPKSLNGFMEDTDNVKKPIAVVNDVRKIVILSSLNVSIIAGTFFKPLASRSLYFDKICIRFEVPTTSIMVGKSVLKTSSGFARIPKIPYKRIIEIITVIAGIRTPDNVLNITIRLILMKAGQGCHFYRLRQLTCS